LEGESELERTVVPGGVYSGNRREPPSVRGRSGETASIPLGKSLLAGDLLERLGSHERETPVNVVYRGSLSLKLDWNVEIIEPARAGS